ncbi:RNA polymerase sigma-70 factor, ECF subfamily [Pedobacter steynii]|uniref:RNA polymerase sigma-70 factor, ECF subfamily n=1 Tax=Pedobacter steynii TaxID=430522 RepID=A0A1G9K9F3_9SPHI|nr:RNA polymerase sigma-70 factor [Pedobacter steynii]NQX38486.1 RNA polymerase sigma-70 factor [Pedobacter steynii]SDL46259.1 RNA polymerase sigma-70 factor, ECF subfamily [Pedobacter steynii]
MVIFASSKHSFILALKLEYQSTMIIGQKKLKAEVAKSAADNVLLLELLHRSYYDRLLYYAWTIIHDKETSRDIVQEAFTSYWNQKEYVSSNLVQVRNFLYVNIKNACLKHLRHDKVVDKYRKLQDPDPVEEACVLNKMIQAEVIGEIYAAIASLPEGCRKISKMGYLEGLKNQEIADQLGISINTVKTQKKRALELLRLKLNPETFLALTLLLQHFKNN